LNREVASACSSRKLKLQFLLSARRSLCVGLSACRGAAYSVEVQGPIRLGPGRAIYVTDPDQNVVEFWTQILAAPRSTAVPVP